MFPQNYSFSVTDRFLKYVTIDTQSDPDSASQPSTEKQKNLSRILVEELNAMGVTDVELDEAGYIYATLPSTVPHDVPVVCLCAHVDTSPDASGANVKPIIHHQWQGQDIHLPDDPTVIISAGQHPYLKERLGDDIITASGTTLLGADDKAGVAIIMDVANLLTQHPEIPHGKVRLLFTPDEEIGRGVNQIDMKKLAADFGYTLDGGERGHLEGENFSADAMTVYFEGISAHPGYAKGKMVSAIKVASDFVNRLPRNSWGPEHTEGYEGFVHPVSIDGAIEKAKVSFIIRDFNTNQLKQHEMRLTKLAEETVANWPGAQVRVEIVEQYRNMKEILDKHPDALYYAEVAYKASGLEPKLCNIRGGTDGARLSFMGLPCPNIFTGEMAIHSRQEYVSVQDMQKSIEVVVRLLQAVAHERKD